MGQLPDHTKGLLITVVGVVVLTPDGLLVRLVAADTWTLLFWRGLLTGMALFLGFAALRGRRALSEIRALGLAGLGTAVIFSTGTVGFIVAIKTTSVANTLVIISAAPLFATLLARLFVGEKVARRTWLAIFAACGGILVIVSGSLGGGGLPGDLTALATAFFMAAGFTMMRRHRHLNMVPAVAAASLMVAVVSWPLTTPAAVAGAIAGPDAVWLGLMGLVIMPLSSALITSGPRYLPAPEVSLIMPLEVVLGPLWVWLVLGEEPGLRAFIGGTIVIAALAGHAVATLRRPAVRAGAV